MRQGLLLQKSFQELAEKLEKFDILEEVMIFGSTVKGNPKPFNYEILEIKSFLDFWRNYRISSEIFVSGYLLLRKIFLSEIFGMIGEYR